MLRFKPHLIPSNSSSLLSCSSSPFLFLINNSSSLSSFRFCSTSSSSNNNNNQQQFSPWIPPDAESIAVKIPHKELMEIPRRIHGLCLTAKWKPENIRNICIVAHVDHGKTTLSDAILRRGGVLDDTRAVSTYMDKLEVERERGITVKSQACTFFVKHPEKPEETVMINLVDTPGHVDFSFEVSRSLNATEGAVLLVDAAQGVQAQTLANMYLALESENTIVPALSKLDAVMNEGQIITALSELESSTGLTSAEVVMTAAKQKRGIESLLKEVIRRVPPPRDPDQSKPFRGLLIDSWVERKLDSNGKNISERIIALVRLREGSVKKKDIVHTLNGKSKFIVNEVGILYPDTIPVGDLVAGQVGYLEMIFDGDLKAYQEQQALAQQQQQTQSGGVIESASSPIGESSGGSSASSTTSSLRTNKSLLVSGDTLYAATDASGAPVKRSEIKPICIFKPLRPVVFAAFFPDEGDTFESLQTAIEKVVLNDPTVTMQLITDPAFGRGMQLGFLGMLHMSVFQQRLESEHNTSVLVTPAQVFYRYRDKNAKEHDLTTMNWVSPQEGAVEYLEPSVVCTILTPAEYQGDILTHAITNYRGEMMDSSSLDDGKRITLRVRMPLADMTRGWFDDLKSMTRGFAQLEYDEPTYVEADLCKIDITVNKAKLQALSTICIREQSQKIAKRTVSALKENLSKSIVDLPIQAFIGNKCIARETLSANRKDVTWKCHAGDISRKRKLLDKQKKGKAKMAKRMIGQCSVDEETLLAVIGASRLGGK